MATIRKPAKKSALKAVPAFDVKALAAELGATVKEGQVTAVRDRYFVAVGQTKTEIPVGDFSTLADVRKLVGGTLPVVISGRTIVAVGIPRRPFCYILCYIPAPSLISQILPEMRAALLKQYVDKGVISQQLAGELGV
jgi:hypothetical protein